MTWPHWRSAHDFVIGHVELVRLASFGRGLGGQSQSRLDGRLLQRDLHRLSRLTLLGRRIGQVADVVVLSVAGDQRGVRWQPQDKGLHRAAIALQVQRQVGADGARSVDRHADVAARVQLHRLFADQSAAAAPDQHDFILQIAGRQQPTSGIAGLDLQILAVLQIRRDLVARHGQA